MEKTMERPTAERRTRLLVMTALFAALGCAATTVIQKENLDNAFRVNLNGVPCVARDGYLVREPADGS